MADRQEGSEVGIRRLYRSLMISPAFIAESEGARLQIMCTRCMVPRDLDVRRSPGLRRYWCEDIESVFSKVRFRCRCGSLARAMRVTRPTRDANETLLLVSDRGECQG